MKIVIYSDNGLGNCKEKLEKIVPIIEIEGSNDEDYPLGEKATVEINDLKTLNKILKINGRAYLWRETIESDIDFYIDLTENQLQI